MAERSPGAQRAIRNYYDNRRAIALQRVGELVTELFLTQGKRRQTHWRHLRSHLEQLDVPAATIDHLVERDDPQLVAKLLTTLQSQAKPR
jgi:hypothetical protein